MFFTVLFAFSFWICASSAQDQVDAVRSPWAASDDPLWFVAKAPNRISTLIYTSQQQKQASLVYMDRLPLSNGTESYASLYSDRHIGPGAGFGAFDFATISMAQLLRRAQENQQRNVVPVSVCGYEETDHTIKFDSMWMPSKKIEYQLQFDDQNQTITDYQQKGYYVISVCSTKTFSGRLLTPSVVIIWHRLRNPPANSIPLEQRISVDVSENECTSANLQNATDLFYPIAMQLFNKGNDVRCTAVWQKTTANSSKFEIRIGISPYGVANFVHKQMMPRQISIYQNNMGTDQLMVLWTNYETRNVFFDGNVYDESNNVPINWLSGSTEGIKAEDKAYFEKTATLMMRSSQIPAMSFAVSKNEQLQYAVAFGYANPLTNESATVTTKFRLGSISKVLTSAVIFSLIDEDKFSLNSKVFGPDGILGIEYGTQPYSKFLLNIKVVNLLEHSSGAWGEGTTGDTTMGFQDYNQSAFIGLEIDKYGPIFEPGTVYSYANFGFDLLGVIITKVTGKPYEQYVKDKFWRPAGVPDDHVGIENRWFSERQPNEAVFHADAFMSTVDAYDLLDSDRVASDGGWIASPTDFLRVTTLFNGFHVVPDVISQSSFNEMTTPSEASKGAACRDVRMGTDFFGYWHGGYYPGGLAFYERHNDGIEVIVMLNKGADSPEIMNAIGSLKRLFIDLTKTTDGVTSGAAAKSHSNMVLFQIIVLEGFCLLVFLTHLS